MTDHFLAIDGGSQSTKVSVVDDAGRIVASARTPLRAYALGPDEYAVHPDDDLWDTLMSTCRAVLSEFDGEITAVGLCGIRSCRAHLDGNGRLLEPVLSWMDARVAQPLTPDDRADENLATVTSAGGYLAVRLTGERRDSAASFVGMWPIDPLARAWATDAAEFERTGMPRSLLPELVDPGDLLGLVTEEAAAETGLPAGCSVYATANDKAVEALGCGMADPGPVLLSLGTYIASMTLGVRGGDERAGSAVAGTGAGFWVNSAAIPGRYLYESAGIRRGMSTVSWVRQLVSSWTPAAQGPVDEAALQTWLTDGATAVPAGCGGLMVVPDWLAPGDAPHRRGAIVGLDGSHGPHHLYRATVEGIVMTMRGHVDAMEAGLGRQLDHLVVSGGGSRSDLVMQIVADVFDRPAQRAGVVDAAGIGAAICAAVGSGVHPSFEAAMTAMTRSGPVFEPDPEARDSYREVREIYASLPEFTDPMFRRMADL